ncbi:plastocyanin/azurin family copper-binding protein [Negadavirga shengliensis]|uniref:Plastocyanin/azurin family copper-binding protein n=1 Tax=Negadavirga shengliensis TaxID=1389218 RepID=A0ABV9SYB2_9BACT
MILQTKILITVSTLVILSLFEKTDSQGTKPFSSELSLSSSLDMTLCEEGRAVAPDNAITGNPLVPYIKVKERFVKPFQEKATTVWIEVVPDLMKFDVDTFSVKAGEKIILELDNQDGMQHNLLIIEPGTLEAVGAAADDMLRDPKASEQHYVPEIAEVLFATEMLGPNEVYTFEFTAPDLPGDYPFVCTFPGHWRMMNGIMRVEAP